MLSYSFEPLLLYYVTCWNNGGKEENYGWSERGRGN